MYGHRNIAKYRREVPSQPINGGNIHGKHNSKSL